MQDESSPARITRGRALAAGAGSLIAVRSGIAAAATPNGLILNGVTVVDTRDGKLAPNMAVVIEGGKIVAITAAGNAPAAGSAQTVDARGKYLVPGFNDYHAHPLSGSDPEGSMALLLAHGVTGFREMAGRPQMFDARKNGTLMPPGDAPELLELAGETLAGPNARSPEVVVAEVQKQKAAGADFIKVIDTRPDVFFAAVAEATRLNLRFLGHLSPVVNVRDASTAGMRSLEHMGPRDAILLGCSSDEAALRAIMAQAPPRPALAAPPSEAAIKRGLANPTIGTPPSELTRYQRVVDTFDEARSRELAAHFVKNNTWITPTLIRVRTMERGDDPIYRNDPNLRYVPQQTRAMWEDVSNEFVSAIPAAGRETLKQLYALQTKIVKPFKAAGVQMMAGSDLGGGFVIAGFGLHQEFDLLAEAGLSPLEILQMTTLNGATFLGREATMGSVAVGKNANLVLLDANPIASAANLHNVAGVVRAGKYFSGADLAALKAKTGQRVAAGIVSAVDAAPSCCCHLV